MSGLGGSAAAGTGGGAGVGAAGGQGGSAAAAMDTTAPATVADITEQFRRTRRRTERDEEDRQTELALEQQAEWQRSIQQQLRLRDIEGDILRDRSVIDSWVRMIARDREQLAQEAASFREQLRQEAETLVQQQQQQQRPRPGLPSSQQEPQQPHQQGQQQQGQQQAQQQRGQQQSQRQQPQQQQQQPTATSAAAGDATAGGEQTDTLASRLFQQVFGGLFPDTSGGRAAATGAAGAGTGAATDPALLSRVAEIRDAIQAETVPPEFTALIETESTVLAADLRAVVKTERGLVKTRKQFSEGQVAACIPRSFVPELHLHTTEAQEQLRTRMRELQQHAQGQMQLIFISGQVEDLQQLQTRVSTWRDRLLRTIDDRLARAYAEG
ncbi:unnamed protein product [Closterium sp. NIES-54]